MNNQEKFRSSASRFINHERCYSVYFIRKGAYFEAFPIMARSLYQAAAHSVNLFSYAFAKLGVLEAVIIPQKASKSGLSVYRQRRGEVGIIKRLTEIKNNEITVSEVLANWDFYKCVPHFLG